MITYPLALPSTNFQRFEMGMPNAVGRTTSPFSFTEQAFSWDGSRWVASVTLPQLGRVQADAWLAFLAALRGTHGTFLLGDPFRFSQRGSLDIAETVLGIQIDEDAPSGFTVATRGWAVDAVGVLLPGDMFQVGYGEFARLYMVTKQVDADGSGLATIDIWPRWRKDINAETPAELLTDPGFENWTGGVLDDWAIAGDGTVVEASTTPSPHGGARYYQNDKSDGTTGSVFESSLSLLPGMPYRSNIWRGKNTSNSNRKILSTIRNFTIPERLLTKRFSSDAEAALGDVWSATSSGASANLQALVADTFYQNQFGFIVPTKYAAADTMRFGLSTSEGAGVSVYYDDASLYGPSFDGMALEFDKPKGLFRLRDNDPGWTMPDLTTYGVAFEAVEALP